MKKLLLICLLILSTQILFSQVRVSGYTRKNGTYVEPHMRSSPNNNPYDNYSFPRNTNPYTGKISTGNPDTYLDNYYNKRSNNIDYSNTGLLKDVNPYMGNTNNTPPNTEYYLNNSINNNEFNSYTTPNYPIVNSSNDVFSSDYYKNYNEKKESEKRIKEIELKNQRDQIETTRKLNEIRENEVKKLINQNQDNLLNGFKLLSKKK